MCYRMTKRNALPCGQESAFSSDLCDQPFNIVKF